MCRNKKTVFPSDTRGGGYTSLVYEVTHWRHNIGSFKVAWRETGVKLNGIHPKTCCFFDKPDHTCIFSLLKDEDMSQMFYYSCLTVYSHRRTALMDWRFYFITLETAKLWAIRRTLFSICLNHKLIYNVKHRDRPHRERNSEEEKTRQYY